SSAHPGVMPHCVEVVGQSAVHPPALFIFPSLHARHIPVANTHLLFLQLEHVFEQSVPHFPSTHASHSPVV
ncbi:MAG: hypothetical protein QF704_07145, partial [Anaerolineales bacterium]|nr:hypothetical protein [Anaerolineales bacterium]